MNSVRKMEEWDISPDITHTIRRTLFLIPDKNEKNKLIVNMIIEQHKESWNHHV